MDQREVLRLYNQYSKDVFYLALSYLHCKQDAEDLCQSIFLKLIEQKNALIPGKEKSWLLTCTANACKNHLNSFWRKNVQTLEDSLVFTNENQRELWEAMQALKPKDRALLHLYYYEGYSQEEIAKILGITRTAVQTRMQRARKKLEEEMKVYE